MTAPAWEDVPQITVTMLGAEGSGKSSFMMGMYGATSSGVDGFVVYAKEFGDRVVLEEHWAKLLEDGDFPPPTDVRGFKYYRFAVNRGLRSEIVGINWLDYRGGAISDREEPEDARRLQERLLESDGVILVLDGARIGTWIRNFLDGTDDGHRQIRRELGVASITALLVHAVNERRRRRLQQPSIVVLITKEDELVNRSGLDRDEALHATDRALRDLLPVAFDPEVTVLVNPTSLDAVGRGDGGDRCFIAPFVFTFLEFLRAGIVEEQKFLAACAQDQAKNEDEIAVLSGRFQNLGRFMHNGRIRKLNADQQRIVAEARQRKETLEHLQAEADILRTKLAGTAIYNGDLRRDA